MFPSFRGCFGGNALTCDVAAILLEIVGPILVIAVVGGIFYLLEAVYEAMANRPKK